MTSPCIRSNPTASSPTNVTLGAGEGMSRAESRESLRGFDHLVHLTSRIVPADPLPGLT